MRRLAVVLIVGWCGSASAEPVRDAVDKLPELGVVTHGRARIVVRGDVSKAQAKVAVALVDQVIADVQAKFTAAAKAPDAEVTLCVLPDDTRYRKVAMAAFGEVISDLGFYRGDHRVAIANLGRSIGNLRHELVHPLLGDDFPQIPAWLNEGIASLYGTAKWGTHGFEFLVNYRLRDLQKALKDGDLPTLDDLAVSTSDDLHGDRAMVWYATARYVLLYADRHGTLSELYGKLRGAAGDVRAQRRILGEYVDDKAFRTWAKTLRY